ncbi:putative kinase [Sporomusaceae bacterium BoRhaA]|uniref:AAA family ATPase n=1 Tax=Pelorhabdus rhamnosifermentans TaxID=2772457 RepID=UPI001C060A51|nr:AAA family ATPase [Pelorhabdus rhamnosifermentans]MBU2701294.1 putative kinase [Pelorhabdus rhamnosifermentans]
MHKNLILLTGYPGTGKTYLCNTILSWRDSFVVVSPDDIKEKFWDKFGFNNVEEKEGVIQLSWNYYYKKIEKIMQEESSIISDYPFSDKQRPKISLLSSKYGYRVITIRLIGNLDILFERQKKRDVDPNRHAGHILNCYHQGDTVDCRNEAEGLLDYKEFIKRCQTRGYGTFELGDLIEIDVTDFALVDYPSLLQRLEEMLGNR